MPQTCFIKAPTSHLLTPLASGAALVLRALDERASLRACPHGATALELIAEPAQRIYCESSGSSGAAKLIRRDARSWIASFDINRDLFEIGPQDSYAVLGHLGYSLSLYAALEALHCGAGLALLSDLRPQHQAAALRQHRITTLYATPSQLRILLRSDTMNFIDLRRVICGGGALDPTLREDIAQRLPSAQLTEFFGASETSFITISDDQTPPGSVGRPYPHVSLQIDGDRSGEIWVNSPYLFEGYEAGHSPLTRWREGYLAIGEIGFLDADGYLFLQGRRSRMVTVADQNVHPEAIETTLMALAGVKNAAVITPQDPLRGHMIVAAVVGTTSEAELRQACRAQLGEASVPRRIWQLEQMPMLAAGKPDLKRLEALWMERA